MGGETEVFYDTRTLLPAVKHGPQRLLVKRNRKLRRKRAGTSVKLEFRPRPRHGGYCYYIVLSFVFVLIFVFVSVRLHHDGPDLVDHHLWM